MAEMTGNATEQLLVAVMVSSPNQGEVEHTLEPGTGLLVGRDQSCGIQLDVQGVASRHCMLQMTGESLTVTDWYSDTGTLVNGEKIYAETRLHERDVLAIGPFTFKFQFNRFTPADDEPSAAPVSSPKEFEARVLSEVPKAPVQELKKQPAVIVSDDTSADLKQQRDEAQAEIGRLVRELEFQKSLAAIKEVNDSPYEDFDESDSDILRAEIEHLQTELTRRESEIEELLALGHVAAPSDELIDENDTARLVTRLEQLLDELQQSDVRVRSLEKLLQISEEATVAEHAERDQLAKWVSEIESRVADREQQWRSSQERLEANVQEATRRYERAEENVQRIAEANVQDLQRDLQDQVTELNQRNAKLSKELTATESELDALNELISKTGMSRSEIEALNERQAEIRQHEIQMAQDRATVARQRAEIAAMREELEKASAVPIAPSIENPDQRIRQFREHLREIHESEQEEKRQRSLGGRISRLFKRLDEK